MADTPKTPKHERKDGTLLKERPETAKPRMFKVLLHNDDYTTREFVVMSLTDVFRKSEGDATQVMMHVHLNGVRVAGVYTREVAETKIHKTQTLARRFEYPLQLSMEPE